MLTCECGETLLPRKGSVGPQPSVCDSCKAKRHETTTKRWREANPERWRQIKLAATKAWKEKNRERVRQLNRESRLRNPRVYTSESVEHRRARVARYREQDPEKWRRMTANASARRRARVREAAVESVDRMVVYERDGGRCHICGKACAKSDFHVDHLVPISRGGAHTYANVATAHSSCNRHRGAGLLPAQLRLVG